MRCGINQSAYLPNIFKIVVITDSIHAAKNIFDLLSHPLQKQVAFILNNLWEFFLRHYENIIESWKCPSIYKWTLNYCVDIKTKFFNLIPLFSAKNSWDFSKKSECDNIINTWKMTFQVSNLKGNNFLDLVDGDDKILKPLYYKDRTWLQFFGYSNSLCVRATRAITNHAPIGEYCLWFFPRENFSYLCNLHPIKTRCHILHKCKRFNEYWNSRKDSIAYFVQFLVLNPSVFAFLPHTT